MRKWYKAITVTEEAIDQYGLAFFIREAMRYDRGLKGISYRVGINGSDFVMNQRAIVARMMRVFRLIKPKRHRKNTISNRKLNRISR